MATTRTPIAAYIFMFYCVIAHLNKAQCDVTQGVDIGMKCNADYECRTGNGGPYSKCHRRTSTCICTVNMFGKNKCDQFEDASFHSLYKYSKMSSIECSLEDDIQVLNVYPQMFQLQMEQFSEAVNDKKTWSCYDPERAFNTIPDGIEIRNSSVHGSGAFTNIFIKKGTVFGPCKGFFAKGNITTDSSVWSWKIDKNKDDPVDYWIDARHIYLSNWLRFVNMAPKVDLINLTPFKYEGYVYYYASRSANPGSELFSFYGAYKNDKTPYFLYDGVAGYVGGSCNNSGQECEHDKNALCLGVICGCKYGTHKRHYLCVEDETLGGICTGSDGEVCKNDINAECQRGVCVCNEASSILNWKCVPDEALGGRCSSPNGATCIHDVNAECIDGLCQCKYASTDIEGKCMKNEMFGGRCIATKQSEPCLFDPDAICHDGYCVHVVIQETKDNDEVSESCVTGDKLSDKVTD